MVLDVKTMPLFEKRIDIKNLHLVEADFVIELQKNGNVDVSKRKAKTVKEDQDKLTKTNLNDLYNNFQLESFKLKDCSVKIINESEGGNIDINPINLETSFKPGKNKITASALLDSIRQDKISLSGDYIISSNAFKFSNFVVNYNDLYAKGNIVTDILAKKPSINLELSSSKIDLDKILGEKSEDEDADKNSGASNSAANDELNLSFLNDFDAVFDIKIDGIKYDKFDLSEEIAIDGKIEGGLLKANLDIDSIYNGSFKSVIRSNQSKYPNYQLTSNIENVDLSMLPDFSEKVDLQKGVLNTNINLKSFGKTSHQIHRNLNGDAKFSINDSALESSGLISQIVNLAKLGSGDESSDKMNFDEMSSSFNIKNAIATSNDFKMVSDIANVTGDGVIDLYNQSLEFKFTPKYSNDLQKDTAKLEIPIILYGSLQSPKVKLDTASTLLNVIKNPAATGEIIDQLKEDLKKGNSIDDIKNLFKN